MSWQVRFTPEADEDLQRLYDFLLMRGEEGSLQAERAFEAIANGLDYSALSPWGCRRAEGLDPTFRELIVSWGSTGYVLLFEIEADDVITVLAVRHQREESWN